MEGKVWTLRAPHAIHIEDDVVVDPAKPGAGDKVPSFPARPRMLSPAPAKITAVAASEYPKSAHPYPNVRVNYHANSKIGGLPNNDPPKDPGFATR